MQKSRKFSIKFHYKNADKTRQKTEVNYYEKVDNIKFYIKIQQK